MKWPSFRPIQPHASGATSQSAPAPRDEAWLPRAWAYLPAYLALAIALGAGCRALAHFITSSQIELFLWAALALNCAISFGVECGSARVRRWFYRVRLLVFALLPCAAVVFDRTILAPLDAESEINAGVALIVGWSAILCVLLVGSRYGKKRLPLAAPLVPGLSLFGLLNSLSVDTLIQVCFLVFIAAALYLVAYEQVVQRLCRRTDEWSTPRPAVPRRVLLPRAASRRLWPTREATGRTAIGYLAACSVWFAAFLGGAALFYYPAAAILPRVLGVPFSAVRGASAALLDWRGSSPVMELRGGNYPLSDRAVFQVEMVNSDSPMESTPVLWRGRIYEQYDTSRWLEVGSSDDRKIPIERDTISPLPLPAAWRSSHPIFDQAKSGHRNFNSRLVRRYQLEALLQPERGAPPALVFPGELVALQSAYHNLLARSNGTFSADGVFRTMPYKIRASIKEERLSGLLHAPGLSRAQLKAWKHDASLHHSLELTPYLRAHLAPIIAQVKAQSHAFDTPYAKANAIRAYLVSTCAYSLSSPLVPATDDAVLFFLTKSHLGACDMFASSMALLLRACDVPARLATGYIEPEELTDGRVTTGGSTLSGELGADEQPALPRDANETQTATADGKDAIQVIRNPNDTPEAKDKDKEITFAFREKDAHAWVEYFVPGAGWLTYDPTAGTRTTTMPLDAQIATFLDLPSIQLNWQVLWLPLCGLLFIGVGVAWSLLDNTPQAKAHLLAPEDVARAHISRAYEAGVALLQKRVPRGAHQTPLEYEAAVHRAGIPHAARQEFAALTFLLQAARYGPHPPTMSDDELQGCVQRLRRALR